MRGILVATEAGPHVRESLLTRWDGTQFVFAPYPISDADECLRVGVEFILAVWRQDYVGAYEMVTLPQFLGVDGISDCLRGNCFAAFVDYLSEQPHPALMANLTERALSPRPSRRQASAGSKGNWT